MKLMENDYSLQTSGSDEGMGFGIRSQDMGVILGILRSKLYSNPIGSICREITSNASDAHTAAGKSDVPIRIELPTALCSEYRVIDYGTGMSPETVDAVFRNYGASTKRDDNSQMGGFGLGSKSAWSYSDSFSIQTIYDGIEYTYTAFIDETDRGKIFLLNESPTDKCNGTTYIVPVQRRDFDDFSSMTYFYTTYFPTRPVVIGHDGKTWPNRNKTLKGNNWNIGEWNDNNRYGLGPWDNEPSLVVGGIPYTINKNSLSLTSNSMKDLLRTRGLVIEAPIGAVHLSASRENLHYDEYTIKYLWSRLDEVFKEIPALISTLIEGSENLWEASINLKSINSRIYTDCSLIKWRGKDILNSYSLPSVVKCSSYESTRRRNINGPLYPNKNTILVYNDISHITRKERIDIIQAESPGSSVLVLSMPKDKVLTDKEFPLTDLGVILLSSIPYTPVPKVKLVQTSTTQKTVNRKPKGSIEGYIYSSQKGNSDKTKGMFSFFNPVFLDVGQVGGVYVSIKSGALGEELGLSNLQFYINTSSCDGYLNQVIKALEIDYLYAFAPKDCESLGNNWITLSSAVRKYVASKKDSPAMKAYLNRGALYKEKLPEMASHLIDLPADHLLNKYVTLSEKMNPNNILISDEVYFLGKHFKTIESLGIVDNTLSDIYTEIAHKYPLFITMVRECYRGSFAERHGNLLIDYIKLIDKREEYEISKS